MDEKDTTEELSAITVAPPAPDRRAGQRSFIAGIVLGVATLMSTLSSAILSRDGQVFQSQPSIMFANLGLITLISVSSALIVSGSNARQQQRRLQPFAAQVADLAGDVRRNRLLLERLTDELRQRDDMVMGHIEAVPTRMSDFADRLAAMEKAVEKVPLYPEAVLDGFDLARGMNGEETDRR